MLSRTYCCKARTPLNPEEVPEGGGALQACPSGSHAVAACVQFNCTAQTEAVQEAGASVWVSKLRHHASTPQRRREEGPRKGRRQINACWKLQLYTGYEGSSEEGSIAVQRTRNGAQRQACGSWAHATRVTPSSNQRAARGGPQGSARGSPNPGTCSTSPLPTNYDCPPPNTTLHLLQAGTALGRCPGSAPSLCKVPARQFVTWAPCCASGTPIQHGPRQQASRCGHWD